MKIRSFICAKADGVKMVKMVLSNLAKEQVNVAPLVFQGFSFKDSEYNVDLVFDGKRNNYKDYEDIPEFWKPCVETILKPGSVEVSLKTLVLHCLKGVGYDDESHVYLPTDDKRLEFMAGYVTTMIDKNINMI